MAGAGEKSEGGRVGICSDRQEPTTGPLDTDRRAVRGEAVSHLGQITAGGRSGGSAHRPQQPCRVGRLDDQVGTIAADVRSSAVDDEIEVGLEAHVTRRFVISGDGRCRWW